MLVRLRSAATLPSFRSDDGHLGGRWRSQLEVGGFQPVPGLAYKHQLVVGMPFRGADSD